MRCHNYLKHLLITECYILWNHLLKSLNSFILADFLGARMPIIYWVGLGEHLMEVCKLNTNLMKHFWFSSFVTNFMADHYGRSLHYLLYCYTDEISCFHSTNKLPKIISAEDLSKQWSKDSRIHRPCSYQLPSLALFVQLFTQDTCLLFWSLRFLFYKTGKGTASKAWRLYQKRLE